MTWAEREFFLKAGFTQEQVEEIDEGMKAGLNTALYVNKNFLPIQMRQIRLGLMEKLPVEQYARVEYDWFQMEEIRKGLKAGVDVSIYAFPELSYEKMRQIRKGLVEGVNLYSYIQLEANIIRELRKARSSNVNILKYISQGYDAEQLQEIRYALERGVELDPYISKEYRAASITQICKGVVRGLDVSLYADIRYSWRQMREIRRGLEKRLEVSLYNSPLYSWDQMREIRLGLEQGIDVEHYRLLRYTAGEMKKKRLAVLEEIHREQERIQQSQIRSEDFLFDFGTGAMEAYITVLNRNKKVNRERLLEILEENNIRQGIQEDAVEKVISGDCRGAVLIAKGQIARKGEDGWYEFLFRTSMERRPKIAEDGTADYRNIEWFETVKEGQKLAVYHEAQDGIDGYNVSGNVIKARKGMEQRILIGSGFRMDEDRKTYYATLNGMIRLEDREMKVMDHLLVDEVNLTTGNVQFKGSIHILGDVCNGAVVRATDDIVIDGNVESAIIESGGSIVLKKGMNAAGRGRITAGKDVVSRFFEAVKVEAKGNIEVDKCLNCQLYADGTIISTGTVAGGVAQAGKGFRIKHAGNQAGLHTVLKIRLGDQVWEENRMVKSAIQDANNELQLLNNSYEEFKVKFPPEVRNEMELFSKIEKAVFTKKKQLDQLIELEKETEELISRSRQARVIVAGQAHAGTIVEMDGCRWVADDRWNIVVKRNEDRLEVVSS